MQRNKNGIVVDIRSTKLQQTKQLSQNYEMLQLDFVELEKSGMYIIMPTDDPQLSEYLVSGYKVLSRFRKEIAVKKELVI